MRWQGKASRYKVLSYLPFGSEGGAVRKILTEEYGKTVFTDQQPYFFLIFL